VDDARRRREAQENLDFFWAMTPIAIKFCGRGHTRLAVKQVDWLKEAYGKAWCAVWRPELLQKDVYHQNRPLEAELNALLPRFGPVIDPLVALGVIRAHCAAMV